MRKSVSWLLVLGGVLLLLAHAAYFRSLFHGNSADDAYISYRYADRLAHGQGLTYNDGERVEGYSNLLWVLVLTPLARLLGDLELPSQLLGLACSAAALLLCAWALRRVFGVADPAAQAAAVLLPAASGYYAAWAMGGLEGPLFGLLLAAALVRWWVELEAPRRRRPVSALLFVAVALVRPEGVFLALGAALVHLAVARRRGWPLASRETLLVPGLIVGCVALYELWRLVYFGPHLLPNSVRAKIGGLAQARRGVLYVVFRFLMPYAVLLVPAFLPATWRRLPLATGFAAVLAYLAIVVAAGGDWAEGRLFAPLLPLVSMLFVAWVAAMLGWRERAAATVGRRERAAATAGAPARAAATAGGRGRAGAPALGWLAMALLLAYAGATWFVTAWQREVPFRRRFAASDVERIAIGTWLRQNVPADALLAVSTAGEIPYYSGLRTHDMLGLTDPHIAGLRTSRVGHGIAGHEKFDVEHTLGQVRPDIIVDAGMVPGLRSHPLYRSRYQVVGGFWRRHEIAFERSFLSRLQRPSGAPSVSR